MCVLLLFVICHSSDARTVLCLFRTTTRMVNLISPLPLRHPSPSLLLLSLSLPRPASIIPTTQRSTSPLLLPATPVGTSSPTVDSPTFEVPPTESSMVTEVVSRFWSVRSFTLPLKNAL